MFAILLILFIVGLASAKQFLIVRNLTPENNQCAKTMKTLATIGAGYFFVHTFFFDFSAQLSEFIIIFHYFS